MRVGTRSSRLARAQTRLVTEGLAAAGREAEPVPVDTLGDRTDAVPVHELGVAGAFTGGLETALARGDVDLAVHSLKDLPIDPGGELEVVAVLERGAPADALLVRPQAHAPERRLPLADGARVATSGPRRQSQLAAARPDLVVANVRGNVDTRVAKLRDGWFDALVTARVALDRMDLDLDGLAVRELPPDRFPPAPGQAAVAVQARAGSPAAELAAGLDHEPTRAAVEAERALLDALGGGCGLPMGAWARRADDGWRLSATFAGRAWTPADRGELARAELDGPDPAALADRAARRLREARPVPRRRPLDEVPEPDGPTLLVVASRPTARSWAARLREAGHRAVPVPTRTFTPADPPDEARRSELRGADWIVVTSPRAAEPLARALDGAPEAYVTAVGPSTARALQAAGLPCHLVAPGGSAASLADEVTRLAELDAHVLLAQGDTVHGDARERLAEAGLATDAWEAYRTREHPVDWAGLDVALPAEAALVLSPRNAEALEEPGDLAERWIAIGPSTARALREAGPEPDVPDAPTPDAVQELLP